MITRSIEELLPFFINNTLSPEDRALVQEGLKKNPALRQELEFLQSLHDQMQELEKDHGPGELGLKRLQRDIRETDPLLKARGKIAVEQNWQWKALAFVACLFLVIQSAVMLPQKLSEDLTAAGGPVGMIAEPDFKVTFVPEAPEAKIRALLTELHVQIVAGPSALGVYYLSGGDDPEKTLHELQKQKDLVETIPTISRP